MFTKARSAAMRAACCTMKYHTMTTLHTSWTRQCEWQNLFNIQPQQPHRGRRNVPHISSGGETSAQHGNTSSQHYVCIVDSTTQHDSICPRFTTRTEAAGERTKLQRLVRPGHTRQRVRNARRNQASRQEGSPLAFLRQLRESINRLYIHTNTNIQHSNTHT